MKSEFKGTPGPWELDQFDNVVHGKPDNWNRKETVRVSGVALPGRVTEEYAANTMLVAAAPQLLEALQRITKEAKNPRGDLYSLLAVINDTQADIAKALGETK